jgi:hypothetical protein
MAGARHLQAPWSLCRQHRIDHTADTLYRKAVQSYLLPPAVRQRSGSVISGAQHLQALGACVGNTE